MAENEQTVWPLFGAEADNKAKIWHSTIKKQLSSVWTFSYNTPTFQKPTHRESEI